MTKTIKKIIKKLNPNQKILTQIGVSYIIMILVLVLVISVIFTIFSIRTLKFYDNNPKYSLNYHKITTDYTLKQAYDTLDLPEHSYIEIVDQDLKVVKNYNSIHPIGYQYSQENFNTLTISETSNHHFTLLNNNKIVLVYISDIETYYRDAYLEKLYVRLLISVLLITIIVILVFTRITSSHLIKPISALAQGIEKISKGDYNTKINFKSNNELGILRDSINKMSDTIKEEISLREQVEQDRKKLILNISHDLKTPLTNICGYGQTLKSCPNLSEENLRYLDIIISNGEKANRLMSDLFQLSHLKENINALNFKRENLCEYLRNLVIEYIPELESKDISYEFDCPEEEIYINMCSYNLGRAFSNIIDNCIKYTGKNPTLFIKVFNEKEQVVIHIEDNGVGISKKYAEDIFKPFMRTDISRNSETGGTGLGLAISDSIISHHNGEVFIDTTVTKGTRFVIRLPKS